MSAFEDDPIAALPFVGDWPPEKSGRYPRCFWLVQSTGDLEQDGWLGQEHALAFLRYEAAQDNNLTPYILPHIVADMPRELTAIEVSFLTIVGIAANAGVPAAERTAAYWKSCRDTPQVRQRRPRKGKREDAA